MMTTLRHVGLMVKNLERATALYRRLGWKETEPVEVVRVQKMRDPNGATIELCEGNWPEHISVNFYEDADGNRVEAVEDIRYPEEIKCDFCERRLRAWRLSQSWESMQTAASRLPKT